MKNLTLPISIVALLASLIALVTSFVRPPTQITDAEIDALVDESLARKEKKYVQALTPKVTSFYEEMLGPEKASFEDSPETFLELFGPAFDMILSIQETEVD